MPPSKFLDDFSSSSELLGSWSGTQNPDASEEEEKSSRNFDGGMEEVGLERND
jgi:hypothetical protein